MFFRGQCLCLNNPAATQHQIAVIEHGRLSGSNGALRLVKSHLNPAGIVRRGEGGMRGILPGANFDLRTERGARSCNLDTVSVARD